MALSTTLALKLYAILTGTADLSTPTDILDRDLSLQLTSGTGANQANAIFHDRRTLSASGTEDLDLTALTTPFGVAVTFTKVKAIIVKADPANTNNVNVTRPASNGLPFFLAAGDGFAVRPGGLIVLTAPDSTAIAVTADTGDLITVTNSAGSTSVTYDVVIVGVGS